MPTVDEYEKGGGWYEFPDGTKKQGEKAAQEYLDGLDVSELFEESDEDEEEYLTEKDSPEPEPEEEEPEEESTYLVRMTIPRVKFAEKGPSGKRYTFTREHPLVVVLEEDTDFFVRRDGFELATPEQAKEFYS